MNRNNTESTMNLSDPMLNILYTGENHRLNQCILDLSVQEPPAINSQSCKASDCHCRKNRKDCGTIIKTQRVVGFPFLGWDGTLIFFRDGFFLTSKQKQHVKCDSISVASLRNEMDGKKRTFEVMRLHT